MSGETEGQVEPTYTGPTYFYHELEKRKGSQETYFHSGAWIPWSLGPAMWAEFLGCFVKVFTISLSQGLASTSVNQNNNSSQTWDPTAVASALMVMAYSMSHISGAHFNPAISLAIALRGKISRGRMFWYWIMQILGSFFGSMLCYLLTFYAPAPSPGTGYSAGEAFFAEMIFTGLLVCVVMSVSCTKATENNSYFGMAQGFCYLAGAFSVGPISGACFNPAGATGMYMWHLFSGQYSANLWFYWFADLIGSMFGGLLYRMMNPQEFENE